MKQLPILLAVAMGLSLTFCTPPKEEKLTEIRVDFQDPLLIQILDLQDRQAVDSLYAFFRAKDPTYRNAAALAFGSIQATQALDSLSFLLFDEVEGVRVAAAYAIGQLGMEAAEPVLTNAFERHDTSRVWVRSNAAILEAIGKCGTTRSLDFLSTISTYQPTDTLLLEGQARAIYRFALRNLVSNQGTELMVRYATSLEYPSSVRLIAANYLYRSRQINLKPFDIPLLNALRAEPDPLVRLPLVVALGKTETDTALAVLSSHFLTESDYRVKSNVLRALKNFAYDQGAPLAWQALDVPNYHIARTAAEYFLEKGTPEEARNYWKKAKDSLHWEVQLLLYRAANRYLPNYFGTTLNSINAELKQRFETSANPYEKAAAVLALGELGWNYPYLKEKAFPSDAPVVRTACMEAFKYSFESRNFREYFGSNYRQVRLEVGLYLKEAIENGDPGMIAIAAQTLLVEGVFFDRTYENLNFLQTALDKLELPKEIETYNELKQTIEKLTGKPVSPAKKPDFNHPIDWDLVRSIPADAQADIQTAKGLIKIRLLPDMAPGSVANFVSLAQRGFFADKTFHRVVSNFVVQGGCPRGDGYGSLDYSIRSELPPLYYDAPGKVGMASSGTHTEGTQFFITHAPAPHLDGRYTIFAEVIEGMDIVHQLEIGDKIQQINLSWDLQ